MSPQGAEPRSGARWKQRLPALAVALSVWAGLFGPSLFRYVRVSLEPRIFTDDARQQVWPFYRFAAEGFRDPEPIADYYLDVFLPIGYRSSFAALARVADPQWSSKIVPPLLLLLTLGLAAAASARLGGAAAGVACGALVLAFPAILEKLAGGLPRAFGSPVAALALLALARGEPLWLAVAVVVAAAFYPAAAVAPALALALWLVVVPRRLAREPQGWSASRRGAVLAAAAALSVVCVLPQLLAGQRYGARIGPADIGRYPEAGPAGRYTTGDAPPYPGIVPALASELQLTLRRGGAAFVRPVAAWANGEGLARRRRLVAGVVVLLVAGSLALAWRRPAARRVLLLAAAVPAAYFGAVQLAPALHIPQRQLAIAVPLLLAVLLPPAAGALAVGLPERWRGRARVALTLAVPAVVLLLFGGRVGARTGLTVEVPAEDGLYAALAGLPRDALVAGWPDDRIDNVPYLSRRAIYLGYETHQAYHAGFVELLRLRMTALTEALFASEPAPLVALRDVEGVSYLVVDLALYRGEAPRYFAPFEPAIRARFEAGRRRGFLVPRLAATAAIYRQSDIVVLDLHRITAGDAAGASPETLARRSLAAGDCDLEASGGEC